MAKRQKEVFRPNEIAHVWANRGAPHGRCYHNLKFEGDLFCSYTTGIARLMEHKKTPYVILNTRGFGPTTAGHQGMVRHATQHIKQFSGDFGGYGTNLHMTPKEIVEQYHDNAKEASAKTHKQKQMMYQHKSEAVRWYDKAIDAAFFFGLAHKQLDNEKQTVEAEAEQYREAYESYRQKVDAATETKRLAQRERWRRAEESDKEEFLKRLDAFLLDHKQKNMPSRYRVEALAPEKLSEYDQQVVTAELNAIKDWREGHNVNPPRNPVMLRRVGDEVETSMGALVPYEEGRRTYLFASRLRQKGWHKNGDQFKVGHYELEAVNENGIVAGCHRITWSELTRFAFMEGWINEDEAMATGDLDENSKTIPQEMQK